MESQTEIINGVQAQTGRWFDGKISSRWDYPTWVGEGGQDLFKQCSFW